MIMNKVPYDPVKDLAPISQTSSQVMLVVVHPTLPVNSIKDLIAYEKAQSGPRCGTNWWRWAPTRPPASRKRFTRLSSWNSRAGAG